MKLLLQHSNHGFRPGPTQTGLYSHRCCQMHEIADLGKSEIVLPNTYETKKKRTDQLRCHPAADLLLCFRICKIQVFS